VATGTLTQTVIYARPTGSDATGDGSLANPYRTFARAILDVPNVIDSGYGYVIDITGLGVENLPQDWTAPPIVGEPTGWVTPNPDPATPYFIRIAALVIRAIPQLALPGTDAIISAGDAAVVSAVGPDLVQLTVGAPRGSWIPGSLKGKMVVKTQSGLLQTGTIFDNTTTDLFIANRPATFNGGAGPLVLLPGETVNIVEPSATLQGPPSAKGDSLVFTPIFAGLAFEGIHLTCDTPGLANGGAVFGPTQGVPFFVLCHLDGTDFIGGGQLQVGLFSTTITDYLNAYGGAVITPRFSYWQVGVTNGGFFGQILGIAEWRTTVFDGCTTLASAAGFVGPAPTPKMGFINCWFRASTGDAIQLNSPTRLDMDTCQIDGAAGNAGVGVFLDDGTHVEVDVTTTVTGALGAYQIDALAPVVAWPGGPFNDVDLSTLSRIWEP
jgi:hypothetical protein